MVGDQYGKRKKNRKRYTLDSNRTCSGFHSHSWSSGPFELFQLSVLFLFAGEKGKEDAHGGVLGVRGDEARDEREERLSGS